MCPAVLRIYALLLLTLPFSLTTDATDFIRALVQQWRLLYRLGYGAMAAFRTDSALAARAEWRRFLSRDAGSAIRRESGVR